MTFNPSYTYLLLDLLTLAGPLILSFDKKVSYYKKFRFLFPSIVVSGSVFIIWDIIFTHFKIWGFNKLYLSGLFFFNLPIEEVLFFIVVPFACIFIYECCVAYKLSFFKESSIDRYFYLLSAILFIVGIISYNRVYTSVTFIGFSILIAVTVKTLKNKNEFLTSYIISLIPFLVMNGVLTYLPIVWYNHQENLNVRVVSIPLEDTMYGFFLIYLTKLIYDKLQSLKRASVIKIS